MRDDLRPISLTADLSKDYEGFLIEWLLPYVKQMLDPGQLGSLKGCSVTHYLVMLFDFILSKTDTYIPHAVMVTLIDFSKGFQRINHNKVLIRLSDWGVPGWLLKVISSYMTDRSMSVNFKEALPSLTLYLVVLLKEPELVCFCS